MMTLLTAFHLLSPVETFRTTTNTMPLDLVSFYYYFSFDQRVIQRNMGLKNLCLLTLRVKKHASGGKISKPKHQTTNKLTVVLNSKDKLQKHVKHLCKVRIGYRWGERVNLF